MLRLNTFGRLFVERDGTRLTGPAAQPRRLALLALMAGSGEQGMTRDQLLGMLWSETDEERARKGLNQALYALRQELGSDEVFLGIRDLRLNPELVTSDVAAFTGAIKAGYLERATAEYTGPFLSGFHLSEAPEFERWLEEERAGLARDYTTALERLARKAGERGDRMESVEWWRKLAAQDPLNARVAMGLMEALVAAATRPARAPACPSVRGAAAAGARGTAGPRGGGARRADPATVAAYRDGRGPPRAPASPAARPRPPAAADRARAAAIAERTVPMPAVPRGGARLHDGRVGSCASPRSRRRAPRPEPSDPSPSAPVRAPWRRAAVVALPVSRSQRRRCVAHGAAAASSSAASAGSPRSPGWRSIPTLSPDGKLVAYAAGSSGQMRIYVRQLVGGRTIAVTEGLAGDQHWPRWSPDGTRLSFETGRAIYVVPALGGTPKLLVRRPRSAGERRGALSEEGPGYLAWSPDGRRIAYAVGREIYVRAVERRARHPDRHAWTSRTPSPGRPTASAWLSCAATPPSSTRPNAIGNIAPSSIWIMSAAGGPPERVTDAASLNTCPGLDARRPQPALHLRPGRQPRHLSGRARAAPAGHRDRRRDSPPG